MSVTLSDFTPTTKINNGKSGLIKTKDSSSDATITGTGLSNNLDVTVLDPPGSTNPTHKWTGKTKQCNSGGTQCVVRLKEEKSEKEAPRPQSPREDLTTVSVTVGDATKDASVYLGAAPLIESGVYNVKCGGSGTYRWLAVASAGVVNLANQSDAPQGWTFTLLQSSSDNCYTIQGNNNQYLNWSSSGQVSLVDSTGAGTTWQLTGSALLACCMATCSPQKYLYGNTSDKSVSLQAQSDPNGETSWTLAAALIA